MRDPSLSVQKAVFDQIRTHPAVQSIVGDRVYDQVPSDVVYPFVKIGDDSFEPFYFTTDTTINAYGLTQSVGMPEAKRLAAALTAALATTLVLTDGFVASTPIPLETDFQEDTERETQLCRVSVKTYVQDSQ